MPSQQVEAWKSAYHTRLNRPQYSRQRADQIAANRQRILKALHDGGVRLLFGTDAPQQFSVPGFSMHREMAVMLQAGRPYDILRAGQRMWATISPTRTTLAPWLLASARI